MVREQRPTSRASKSTVALLLKIPGVSSRPIPIKPGNLIISGFSNFKNFENPKFIRK
jgi:hypothetical protein